MIVQKIALTIGERSMRLLEVTENVVIRYVIYHFLLVVCNNSISTLHYFPDITTFTDLDMIIVTESVIAA